jgi:hypothetical protein
MTDMTAKTQPKTEVEHRKETINNNARFYEPLRWYDVASPLMGLMDSGRIPANYNPVEFDKVKLKQQNPQPALEAVKEISMQP